MQETYTIIVLTTIAVILALHSFFVDLANHPNQPFTVREILENIGQSEMMIEHAKRDWNSTLDKEQRIRWILLHTTINSKVNLQSLREELWKCEEFE